MCVSVCSCHLGWRTFALKCKKTMSSSLFALAWSRLETSVHESKWRNSITQSASLCKKRGETHTKSDVLQDCAGRRAWQAACERSGGRRTGARDPCARCLWHVAGPCRCLRGECAEFLVSMPTLPCFSAVACVCVHVYMCVCEGARVCLHMCPCMIHA
jgi:hypothetical protein